MSLITEAAPYRGVLMEHAVSATKKGLPQFVAKLRGLERYDSEEKAWISWETREDSEITAYLVLFDGKGDPIFHAKDIQKVFEWDGTSLIGLETLDLEGAEVQFEVVEHTYNEKTSLQVASIRGYNEEPGNAVRKLEANELAQLNAKYGNALKKLSGGPKAASAKTKAKIKIPPAAPITKKKDKSAPPPPPPAAPTEAEAVAEATKSTPELPVNEAVEEFNKPTVPPVPNAAPVTGTKALTYEGAWAECYSKKNKTTDDKQIAAVFSAAMHRQAPGKDEKEITSEEWKLIVEAVIGECG